MASYQDLLDAIARVRAATGDRDSWQDGLSGPDIAAACSVFSTPSALGEVLAKIIASHPDAFVSDPVALAPPRPNEGLAADAIRDAETALAQQNSTAAQVDLQVVTAVLNAHAANAEGAAELDRLQRDIETAVMIRTDLDTPAGAREFQRFLTGKLRDIRAVVDAAGLDATSKAALSVALASLYASATPQPVGTGAAAVESAPPEAKPEVRQAAPKTFPPVTAEGPGRSNIAAGIPSMWGPAEPAPWDVGELPVDFPAEPAAQLMPSPAVSSPAPAPMPGPAPAPLIPPAAPTWGGGLSPGMPFNGGAAPAPSFPDIGGPDSLSVDGSAHRSRHREEPEPVPDALSDEPRQAPTAEDTAAIEDSPILDPNIVRLPDGRTVSAPTPEVAAAITAAVAGTPIPEAFGQQGITLPPPGSAVLAPVEPGSLLPGDIGVLPDRFALALGNGQALLDQQIRPVVDITAGGFLGWQHPPVPAPATHAEDPTTSSPTPDLPAPPRPLATAPS